MKFKAFTLAEVLITLAVIGVVAALTMPIVIGKYQKKVLVTQLKKEYTLINNVVRRIYVDDNCETFSCAFQKDGADYMVPKLKKYMNIYDVDETSGDLKDFVKAINSNENIVVYNGFTVYGFSFRLNDGSRWYYNGSYGKGGIITVDVNGDKNPNKVGRDFFQMFITEKGYVEPMLGKGWVDSLCDMATCDDGFQEEWLSQVNEACQTNTNSGDLLGPCLNRIISDGWEMKY